MAEHKTIVVLLVLGFISYSSCLQVASCPGGLPRPKSVSVEGCDREPCEFYLRVGVNFNATFESLTNTYTMRPRVEALQPDKIIEYPLNDQVKDACKFILNGYCPIEKGEILIYNLRMAVFGPPGVETPLRFSLLGDRDVVHMCFGIRVVIRR